MPAVVVHGAGDLRVEEVVDQAPGPGEVLVRVLYGGICGSDLHYLESGAAGKSTLREPLILGHEVSGEIAEIGAGVDGLAEGQRVVVSPRMPCQSYLGSAARFPHVQGGFRDRLVVAPEQVVPLPDEVPLPLATLAEPLAVVLHAISRLGDVSGSDILVVGLGPIGLLAVIGLSSKGARVTARDLAPAAVRMAQSIGAVRVELAAAADEELPGVDAAIECSGSAGGLAEALRRTGRGGRVVEVGMPSGSSSPVDVAHLVAAEIELVGSFRFEDEITAAVDLLMTDDRFRQLISAVFPITRAATAFALAADRDHAGKVLLGLNIDHDEDKEK
jgi:L-idonate 5-dehydrogenase